jgi:hypothetical protein
MIDLTQDLSVLEYTIGLCGRRKTWLFKKRSLYPRQIDRFSTYYKYKSEE